MPNELVHARPVGEALEYHDISVQRRCRTPSKICASVVLRKGAEKLCSKSAGSSVSWWKNKGQALIGRYAGTDAEADCGRLAACVVMAR